MCQLLQPWGYVELAFPTINIQRDSHLEPTSALLRFRVIYLFLFIYIFIFFIGFSLFGSLHFHFAVWYSYFLMQGFLSHTW